jgi:hypothetical protein
MTGGRAGRPLLLRIVDIEHFLERARRKNGIRSDVSPTG